MEMLLVGGLAVASTLDWKYRKIPNWLTLSLIITALFFHTFSGGADGFFQSLLGFFAGIALLYIPFALGGMGGGDVKLMGAIGAWVGPVAALHVFLLSAVIGAFFSLGEAIRQKRFKATMKSLKERLLFTFLSRKVLPEDQLSFSENPVRIPYALSLTVGALWVQYGGGIGLWTF